MVATGDIVFQIRDTAIWNQTARGTDPSKGRCLGAIEGFLFVGPFSILKRTHSNIFATLLFSCGLVNIA